MGPRLQSLHSPVSPSEYKRSMRGVRQQLLDRSAAEGLLFVAELAAPAAGGGERVSPYTARCGDAVTEGGRGPRKTKGPRNPPHHEHACLPVSCSCSRARFFMPPCVVECCVLEGCVRCDTMCVLRVSTR